MNSENKSDTPRTDAFELAFMQKPLRYNEEMVMSIWDCHRTLERENNQLHADLKMCAEALKSCETYEYQNGALMEEVQSYDYNKVSQAINNPRIQSILNEKESDK